MRKKKSPISRFIILTSICLTLIAGMVYAVRAGIKSPTVLDIQSAKELVILFTHDLHSYFLPHATLTKNGKLLQQGGYAKLAYAIDEQRRRHPHQTLLLDAGDFSMGTLFHTLFMTEALELRLMGTMGYDATTLGNHEFDFHPWGLAAMLSSAIMHKEKLPAIVASNIILSKNDPDDAMLKKAFADYPVKPYIILERNGLRIGVFGVIGRDAAHDAPYARPVAFSDAIETGKRMADLLKNQEKVDLIICLSHSGTSPIRGKSEDEKLAKAVPQIDVIISGHTHTVLSAPIVIGKTLIVAAGCCGNYLGVLELRFHENGPKLVSYELKHIAADVSQNKKIAKGIAAYKDMVNRNFLAPSGLTYDKVIAESDFDLEPPKNSADNPQETALGDLITDAYRAAVKWAEADKFRHVHFALVPAGNIRDGLRKGKITAADVFGVLSLGTGPDMLPGYPLVSFYISGKELKNILEVHTTIAPLEKRDAYLQVSGVKFTYNPHRVWFDRVTSAAVEDEDGTYRPLEKNKLYRVCANLYTASMIDYVGLASHGLIKIEPKDQQGNLLKNVKQAIVHTQSSEELKEWRALAWYLRSFKATGASGVPQIPEKYSKPQGRYFARPSLNPIDLFGGGNWITYSVLAFTIFVLIFLIRLVLFTVNKIRKKE